jgi:hypothetical protein
MSAPSSVVGYQTPGALSAAPVAGQEGGRRGVSVKAMKKLLKKNGLKVSGKKATLRMRAKKAHLMGGADAPAEEKKEEAMEVEEMTPTAETAAMGGRKMTAKGLKKVLKAAGLKASGTKRSLTMRAKKARLL